MIRKINNDEIQRALALVKDVYYKTEYINDTEEGRITFETEFLMDSNIQKNNEFYGYFIEKNLVGVAAFHKNAYIQYLFVDTAYASRGIGTALLHYVLNLLKESGNNAATLDSTIYGYEFYLKMGFKKTSDRVSHNGMSYIPMKIDLQHKTN